MQIAQLGLNRDFTSWKQLQMYQTAVILCAFAQRQSWTISAKCPYLLALSGSLTVSLLLNCVQPCVRGAALLAAQLYCLIFYQSSYPVLTISRKTCTLKGTNKCFLES